MIALKTVIRHRVENQKIKHIAYVAFLVLTTILIVYSIMLLFQDISILGKSEENAFPTHMPTSPSVFPLPIQLILKSFTQVMTKLQTSTAISKSPESQITIPVVRAMYQLSLTMQSPIKRQFLQGRTWRMNILHGSI
jgi:hypothetical protein